jgi:hypothetical protein
MTAITIMDAYTDKPRTPRAQQHILPQGINISSVL